jgi:hypothetical protein
VLGRALLEESLAVDAVREADPGEGPTAEVREDSVGDPRVEVDRLALGEGGL